jgi:predicted RNA polymerase sigma factor
MWRITSGSERALLLSMVKEFMANTGAFREAMMRALKEWPNSCEMNMSATSINKQAFIGHAACCIAINCPEDVTRCGWHELTQEQQDRANAAADEAIAEWQKINQQKTEKGCRNGNLELMF